MIKYRASSANFTGAGCPRKPTNLKSDKPALELATDLNVYCHSFQRILAPHTAGGVGVRAESYFEEHPESYQQTPVEIGAKGGKVGLLDGSARWKRIEEMRVYRASQAWELDGAFGYW